MNVRGLSRNALSCLLPAAYVISNKTVLTLHGFRFPSVFLSWQLLVAITAIALISRPSVSATDIASTIPDALLFVVVIYTGSRSLATLPLPLFLGGEFLALHCVECYLLYRRANLRSNLHILNGIIVVFLLGVLSADRPPDQLLFLAVHSAAHGVQWFISRTATIPLSETISSYVNSTIVLILFGVMSGEITRAAEFDYSHTHFKLNLLLSGVLSAGCTLTDDKERKEYVSRCVAVRVGLTLVLGYGFAFGGTAVECLIASFFVFLLFLDCYFSRATSDPGTPEDV